MFLIAVYFALMYSFVVDLTTVVLTPMYFNTLYLVGVKIIKLHKKQKLGPLFLTILQMGLTTVFLIVVYFTFMYFFAVHFTELLHYA